MDNHNAATMGEGEANWETLNLAVGGMTCDNCVKHVARALRGVNGVKAVEVDRQSARASVIFDSTKSNLPDLLNALQRSGYEARPIPNQEP